MKLVITYSMGDGCSFSCQETIPVEYESEEAFAVDFEEAIGNALASRYWELSFAGHVWNPGYFFSEHYGNTRKKSGTEVYCPPGIQTLEDWFESNKVSTE